ncbi:MAG: alanine racemase [Fusobacteriaceae bacterium]
MRAWVEINLKNLVKNLNTIKSLTQSEIIPVIKADAYGMGALRIVQELIREGIEIFAVATMEEAVELREKGIEKDILVLGGVYYEDLEQAHKLNIQITINSRDQIEKIREKKLPILVHMAVETGMGRVGFLPEEALEIIEDYRESETPKIVGVYSHFSVSDEDSEKSRKYTLNQIELFQKFLGTGLQYIHMLNSGGIINYSEYFLGTHVRPGIALYGILGDRKIEGMHNVFSLKTRILFLKTLKERMDISYGRTATGEVGETIATLSIGYADGFRKELSNRGYVTIMGEKCPIIGKICMDMCMVKIPETIKDKAKVGMEVLCIGEDIVEKSVIIGCSTYEILTGIGKRLPRVYI